MRKEKCNYYFVVGIWTIFNSSDFSIETYIKTCCIPEIMWGFFLPTIALFFYKVEKRGRRKQESNVMIDATRSERCSIS